MDLPRKEHPRPQFERKEWMNLNGEWSFRFDFGKSGKERGWYTATGFEHKITVPFCPESKLSGVGYTDFIPALWYHRKIRIPQKWQGKKVLFHCAGIDYRCEVYLDGNLVGTHTGTASPITMEMEPFVKFGREQDLVIYVIDDTRSLIQPLGKQSFFYQSRKCVYTRTTGIWQTVWLESVDQYGLRSCRITPNYDEGSFAFTPQFWNTSKANTLEIRILDQGKCIAEKAIRTADGATTELALKKPKEWNPETPFLYDVELKVKDGNGNTADQVFSYAGLRKFHCEGNKLFLNNRPIYLRFVLDQGFYPDGIWTAPSDEALQKDIQLAMAAGFNGARLHQKIFEERFHYWADRMGYLTWAEFPDWGMGFWKHFANETGDYYHSFRDYFAQWESVVMRDVNHPSIIAWTPFNETTGTNLWDEHYRIIADIYDLTKHLDPTRPVNDTSGYYHSKTDLWTAHTYAAPEELKKQMSTEPVWCVDPEYQKGYHGQPYLVDEYGGVSFLAQDRVPYADNSWGYGGNIYSDPKIALDRIKNQTDVLVDCPKVQGYCYTQLTDVEQEQNGIYYYDRTPKFKMKTVRTIFTRKPEWSKW